MTDLRPNNREGSLDEMPITPVISGSSSKGHILRLLYYHTTNGYSVTEAS
ncbi:DEHA2E04048p [Debaryomyces hansenii CBS767]|uniref:DEHA2E04048p n=1 Tax=Debaryomyces hansenii (strain ATCC 36239 / CBS 767 / BCRC 21394 / JCM 1990 / NBRC 0083 / IGC 2968) TaxID=284592 RepID=Q6BQM1_DEBHA|nr:DEHA2E04048p [Debaryomyces hansenii CBS767]CAG87722.1 DEHA2E04048p [Debaryomyces hansenii CBS767]|eukprot:XP_459499.1 DEHA2E04048p [Debaryomyces hansenii CBS767]